MLRSSIRTLDALGLKKHPRLRLLMKRAYCRVIDPFDRGRLMRLDGAISVRVPTFLATAAWCDYEGDSIRACRQWLLCHPDAVLADVGCSIAIYSLMALQVSPGARVFAFDADTNSLKTSAEFCRFSDSSRLSLIHGFLTDTHASQFTLEQAAASTLAALSDPNVKAEPTAVRFLCLDRPLPDEVIPRHSLDGLLDGAAPPGTPMLIKIDVEGAELVVLRGASRLLLHHRPTLMLSVHPQFLPSFQHSPDDVANFLREHGYEWSLLNTDHEEHWWCEPTSAAARAR